MVEFGLQVEAQVSQLLVAAPVEEVLQVALRAQAVEQVVALVLVEETEPEQVRNYTQALVSRQRFDSQVEEEFAE